MKIGEDNKNTKFCAELWEKYEPCIRRLCNVKLPDRPDDVNEIVSETYLALCEAVNKGKTFVNPYAWLYSTANNLIKQKFIKLKIYRTKHQSISNTEIELKYNIDFLDLMISDDDIERMKDEIEKQLTESEKLLLQFVYVDKLKTKEIAKILNSTEAAVKQKRYRLVNKIKQMAKDLVKNN